MVTDSAAAFHSATVWGELSVLWAGFSLETQTASRSVVDIRRGGDWHKYSWNQDLGVLDYRSLIPRHSGSLGPGSCRTRCDIKK
jgi:hypothetical protein